MDLTNRMAGRIEQWPIERLRPYERNARTHSDAQVQKLAASIAEFGFVNPIIVDSEDGILAGHGRLMAAKFLALTHVPVIIVDHLNNKQRRAYILADNRLALDAGWDEELLRSEIADLEDLDFDVGIIGFEDAELSDLFGPEEPTSTAPVNRLVKADDPGKGNDPERPSMDESNADKNEVKPSKEAEGARELDPQNFQTFEHTCPKCGFEFD